MSATILLIEDNASNLELATLLLESAGFTVIPATSAELGLSMATENPPDLILMDIRLPGLDGLTATQMLAEQTEIRDIPVIALTAHVMPGAKEAALAAGCRGFITKPIDTRTFAQTVAKFLESSNAQISGAPGVNPPTVG